MAYLSINTVYVNIARSASKALEYQQDATSKQEEPYLTPKMKYKERKNGGGGIASRTDMLVAAVASVRDS